MTVAMETLSGPLAAAVERVRLDPGALNGHLDDFELTAESTREMTGALARELYNRLHAGRGEQEERARFSYRDRAFEARLAAATPHKETLTEIVPAPHSGDERNAVVLIDGLRVRVPRSTPIGVAEEPTTIPMVAHRPALSPGFFLVDGPSGRRHAGPVLRVYVHLDSPDVACDVWHRVLRELNDRQITYRAKISSSSVLYPRQDALVIYLGATAWSGAEVVRDVVMSSSVRPGFASSPFTHLLAPGVSVAWEPADGRAAYGGLSFGEHRSRVLAETLVEFAVNPQGSMTTAVNDAFRAASIDPGQPARNLDSPDLSFLGLQASVTG